MRRLIHITFVAGLATAALGGSATAQDMRSPDARAAAQGTTPAAIDLRSPDARAVARDTTPAAIDMRSPDARAVARDTTPAAIDLRSPDARGTTGVPTFEPGVVAPTHVVHVPANGFQWGDAGIGAAATLGLIALCGGVLLLLTSRRRDRRVPRPVG